MGVVYYNEKSYELIERVLGYSFKDENLLVLALSHTSYTSDMCEDRQYSNERLEFLGDAILELVISNELYRRFPEGDEGILTRMRSSLVRGEALKTIAEEWEIGSFIILGKGGMIDQISKKTSVLADVVEAVFGAIFIDSDFYETQDIILKVFRTRLEMLKYTQNPAFYDYKSRLQEIIQKKHKSSMQPIKYKLHYEEGLAHNKTFHMSLFVRDKLISKGIGKTKKAAEQSAALEALIKMGEDVESLK